MQGNPSPTDKMPTQAAETDPVLCELDGVLGADPLYQQVCAKLDRLTGGARPGEVLLRMLLVKHLYGWSEQQTTEQVADSLVLRWFCRLGMQSAPTANSVRQGLDQVPVGELEALTTRVEQANERAQKSEGRLRPTYRQHWR
jgi:IS5 family transposase